MLMSSMVRVRVCRYFFDIVIASRQLNRELLSASLHPESAYLRTENRWTTRPLQMWLSAAKAAEPEVLSESRGQNRRAGYSRIYSLASLIWRVDFNCLSPITALQYLIGAKWKTPNLDDSILETK
jgi:hypothetical protein